VKDTDIIAAIAPDAVSLMDKAIAEIKRLRQENATLTAEHDALRAERDEARRRLCLEWTEHGPVRLSKEQIAMRYGWDCFKENTNG
jgi:regulator of replication initiation timing